MHGAFTRMCRSSSEGSPSHNEDNFLLTLNRGPAGGFLEAGSSMRRLTIQRSRPEASTLLRRWGFFFLISSLRMPTLSFLGILTGNSLFSSSPRTKQLSRKVFVVLIMKEFWYLRTRVVGVCLFTSSLVPSPQQRRVYLKRFSKESANSSSGNPPVQFIPYPRASSYPLQPRHLISFSSPK